MSASDPITILLIDSNLPVRTLLKRWIGRTSEARVIEAQDGIEGLEMIASEKPELMIIDLDLPLLSGVDLLRIVQQDARNGLEVLVAASKSGEAQVREAISLGVADYIIKPLQDEWVMRRVSGALERVRNRRRFASSTERETPRVLFAAPDPNFRDFASSSLAGSFAVETISSMAEVFVRCLRWDPDLVIVSDTFPKKELEFISSRLKHIPTQRNRRVYLLSADGSKPEPEGDFDGSIRRTFVPSQLLAEIRGAYSLGETDLGGLDNLASVLQSQISTAVQQTLGMLTGVDPEVVAATEPDPSADICGMISLTADDQSFHVRIQIHCDRPGAQGLGAALLGLPEEECEDAVGLDAISEILNVVGGRCKNSCDEHGIATTLGLPEIGAPAPSGSVEPTAQAVLATRWKEHTFWTDFRVFRAGAD